MKKILFTITLLSLGMTIQSKGVQQIKVKTTYKRSKKIWGVYTQKKQEWFKGKKKHRIGVKHDRVLMRKDGHLVFISPKMSLGVLSYNVLEVPYVKTGKKKIKIEGDNLTKLEFNKIPIVKNDERYETVSYNCKNKWKTIECTQVLRERDLAKGVLREIARE
ncbi:hypothetical protein A9Q84_02980 [Halobacteriovorax marinus]|uniref:Uncharacterized protein n=1 Tax=Halobacteriovorax marinus TaxID=97084 RepID=A0A1Y5FCZ2_9BACT|nr:hypothetical protein A9Q84_02980 [Halobacteriovorax marinus]